MRRMRKMTAILFPFLLLAAFAFVIGAGCGDDDDNPADNGGNGGNGGNGEGTYVTVPNDWAGVWRDSSYFEYDISGQPISNSFVDTITICPEMPADSAAGLPEGCSFTWSGNTLTVSCTNTQSMEGCETTYELEFTQTVGTNSYTGSGTMEMTYGSGCGALAGETVSGTYYVSGTKIGAAPDPCVPDYGPSGTGGGEAPVEPDPDPGEGAFSAVVTNGSTVDLDWTDGEVLVYYNTADGSYSVNAGFGETRGIVISTPPNTAAGTYGLEGSASGNEVGAVVTDPDGYMSEAGGTITFTTVTTSRIAGTFDFDYELIDLSMNTIDKTMTGSFDVSVDFAGKAPDEMIVDRMFRLILGGCPTCP